MAMGPRSPSAPALDESWRKSQEKTGINYLKGSKIGSSTGFLSVCGTILALPHGKRSVSAVSTKPRFDAISEMQANFREIPHCFASMDKKPLSPYNPSAYRSRLALDDVPVPYKNASNIEFNSGMHVCHKRRLLTTHQIHYTGEQPDARTNTGTLSEESRYKRIQREM
mmetsp:Transcript_7696/g.16921  ORF Transcript_7696/g.16921 Transcript_7696/m.16921 type:complete len:168 (-) Transcript_7696:129-632(-)